MKNYPFNPTFDYANVRELIEGSAKLYGEKIAFSYKAPRSTCVTRVSFENLKDDVRAAATGLHANKLSGKHIAVISKISYNYALAYFSLLSSGSVIVPLDPEWSAADLAATVARAECEYVLYESDIAEKADAILAYEGTSVKSVFTLDGEGDDSFNGIIAHGKECLKNGDNSYFDCKIKPNELSLLVFTSGTTGKGKGVMLSQTNIVSNVRNLIKIITIGNKTVAALPPHHTFGSTVNFLGHVTLGSEVYLSGGLKYIQKELKEEKPTHLVLVPLYLETFYRKIWANIKKEGKEELVKKMMKASNAMRKVGVDIRRTLFSSILAAFGGEVRLIICGGAPISREILEAYDAWGITVLNGYGITECSPVVAVNRNLDNHHGSVGSVVPEDKVIIHRPNELGEGEIRVKGPNVMLGYFKDEEATAEAFDRNGYFKTGDYGKLENDILTITGRKKNLIILSNGKNVYPEEIESELVAVPGVLDIVVYEGQSRRGIEYNAIVAEIYPDKEFLEKNNITDVKEYFRPFINEYNKNAVTYKKISLLKVRKEEFPKNTLRKIMRFKIDMSID